MTKQDNMKVFMRRAAMTLLLAVFTVTAWAQYEYIERYWNGSMVVETTKSTSSFWGLSGDHSND